ncbi:hypothetical protein HZA86_01550 [Candidatus Uhrbacteria bacterium]|nr:hypothetical protein [Candidatus Uhrbacteria bacterium]
MKWKKLGKIFDPIEHTLPHNCIEYAQSPQALVFNGFVRMYFSTRERDAEGNFLSHVAFVNFDKNFRKILNVSSHTVITLGSLGCYDEHGIFPFNVLRVDNKIFGYISGWSRRVSVPVETSIGLAISKDDGLTFQRIGPGPVLSSTLHEPFLVGDPFVAKFGDTYHMWYIYGTRWINSALGKSHERVYKIGHAASKDGVSWEKDGTQLIPDKLNVDECQALPTVIKYGGIYHMFFCYRPATGFRTNRDSGYRIGYAYGKDLQNWKREDERVGIDVSENGWDSNMLCYPHLFHCDGRVYMLYNGNEFGRYGFGLAILEDSDN